MSSQPTVGRIVHFTPDQTSGADAPFALEVRHLDIERKPAIGPLAAIVTGVEEKFHVVHLAVFAPGSWASQDFVPYSEEPKPGYWSWPPRG